MKTDGLFVVRIRRNKRQDLFYSGDSRLLTVIKSSEASHLSHAEAEEALKRLQTASFFLCADGAARIVPVEEADLPDPPMIRFHIAYRAKVNMGELRREVELLFKKKYPLARHGSTHSACAVPDYIIVTGLPYEECKEMETILHDIMEEAINERMDLQYA